MFILVIRVVKFDWSNSIPFVQLSRKMMSLCAKSFMCFTRWSSIKPLEMSSSKRLVSFLYKPNISCSSTFICSTGYGYTKVYIPKHHWLYKPQFQSEIDVKDYVTGLGLSSVRDAC